MTPITLDRTEKMTKIASLVAIPLVIAFMGHYVSVSMQQAEINAKFLELAIDVLQEEPAQTEAGEPVRDELREWAIGILKEQTGSGLNENAQEALRKRALPPPREFQTINPELFSTLNPSRDVMPFINYTADSGRPSNISEGMWEFMKTRIREDTTTTRRPRQP